jgi:hypothetical protein
MSYCGGLVDVVESVEKQSCVGGGRNRVYLFRGTNSSGLETGMDTNSSGLKTGMDLDMGFEGEQESDEG